MINLHLSQTYYKSLGFFVVLLFILALLNNPSFAQKQKPPTITANYENVNLVEALKDLQTKYNLQLTFIGEQLKEYTISAELRNEPLSSALEILLETTPFTFNILKGQSVLIFKDPTKVIKKAKRFTIRGKVTDGFNDPLEGVEVYIMALKKYAFTKQDGNYDLTNVPEGKFLVRFRKDGYYHFTEVFNINKDAELSVQLAQSSKHSLNESSLNMNAAAQRSLLDKELQLERKTGAVLEILKEVESKGGFTFSYNDGDIPLYESVTLSDSSESVKEILDQIFNNTRVEIIEWESKIILKARKAKAEKITISGIIKEKRTGEVLPGATVVVKDLQIGAVTNSYGFYSLTVPEWDYTLVYSYIGYKSLKKEVSLSKDMRLDVELEDATNQLNEVVVLSQNAERHIKDIEMGTSRLDIKTIKKMPAFMGEVDLLKSLTLLPGVSTVGEGATGFNVRGGSIDQNLVLMDEAQVFNTSHLFGFFSVFNADAIKESKLYKGGIPALYGGRLSSVLDVTQKEGNDKTYGGTGGLGLVASRLTLEGPIVKNKGSFIVAGRRSYADAFFKNKKLAKSLELPEDNIAYFYDLNAKINYKINDKNRIFLSGYFGRDNYKLGREVAFDWGNRTATIRYNHLFSEKLFSNITAVYSDYDYYQGEPEGYLAYRGKTGIINYNLKTDFTYYLNNKHKVDFGAAANLFRIEPGKAWPINDSSSFTRIDLVDEHAVESGVYISDEYMVNKVLTIYAGLRYSGFFNIGPGKVYSFEAGKTRSLLTLKDTLNYKNGEIGNQYGGLEPRLSLKYEIDSRSSIKVSYNRMIQYLHLVSNTTAATPLDVWKPSNINIKPQKADQIGLGYFRNLRENTLEASVEVYYKSMDNILDYKNGADLIVNEMLDADLLQGKGRAYGIELLINKKVGRLTGWTSYTYSRTERKIETEEFKDQINYGEWYPSNYDQPHKVNTVVIYQLSQRINLSSNFTYNTGRPATYPDAQYSFMGSVIPHYSARNRQRIPDYHRLDISATLEGRGNRWWKGSWTLAVYNVYARKNAYSVFFRQVEGTKNTESVKLSIIGTAIPSLTYNFKF